MKHVMKKIFALISISLLTIAVNAQSAALASGSQPAKENTITSPIVSTETEDALSLAEVVFDFGRIPQGKPVTHVFEVQNTGKDSLFIVNVVASCGCTTPEWEKEKVQAPGGKTKIIVGYNAASEGPFNKSITITYNGTKTKQINIKGEVWKTPVSSAPENKALDILKD